LNPIRQPARRSVERRLLDAQLRRLGSAPPSAAVGCC